MQITVRSKLPLRECPVNEATGKQCGWQRCRISCPPVFFLNPEEKRGDGCGKTKIITGYEDLFDQLMQGHVRLKECPDALEKFTSLN